MKAGILTCVLIGILQAHASACPACVISSPQKNSWQTFWILSFMGILPIIVGIAVMYLISRIVKKDEIKIS